MLKKGDRKNLANYRPVALLTSLYKVFEKIIYDRLLKHIEANYILVDEQFGFRISSFTDKAFSFTDKAFSFTDKASYKLIDEILNLLNNRMMVGGIFCDLEKSFDCVNRNILLMKLEFYGITGIT